MGTGIQATMMRGGTSKGIFFEKKDLPDFGPELDALLLDIMGSPDPTQIDGMGGTFSSTSKVVIVEPIDSSSVKYWFAQIGILDAVVDWGGNCGNLTTAVGPFAIDRGLVDTMDPVTTVHLVNMNTEVRIDTEVHTNDGQVVSEGDLFISGVPNPGSPVSSQYIEPSGSVFPGRALPTGNPTDQISGLYQGKAVSFNVSIVDVSHPYVFVDAAAFGLDLREQVPEQVNADPALLDLIEWVRASVAVKLQLATSLSEASTVMQSLPRIVLLSEAEGETLRSLSFSMKTCHRAIPITAALCIAAAAHIPGTVAAQLSRDLATQVRIQHPRGVAEVSVEQEAGGTIKSLTVFRTARKLMSGKVFPRAF